jgi:WD40 repeat protein/serine/threonine protein kinase/tetratricopeptide (TPR) repeat protein
MALDERLVDLLMQAEDLQQQGYAVCTTELCREVPDLQPALERLLLGTGAIDKLLHASATIAEAPNNPVTNWPSVTSVTIRGYKLYRELGRGGMGVVYEAEQQSLGRRVAVKVLPPHSGRTSDRLARFKREMRAAARLHHTNIVPVFEVGEDSGVWFYSMQYISGLTVREILSIHRKAADQQSKVQAPTEAWKDLPASGAGFAPAVTEELRATNSSRPLPNSDSPSGEGPARPSAASRSAGGLGLISPADPRRYFQEVARAGQQVAEALACAQAHGILHRDIKPANLLVDESGRVWIANFGLAKIENDDLTESGTILGTLRYTAPEQLRGSPDIRSDIYSLGMTLYELLVLRAAFDAEDHLQLLNQVSRLEPPAPRSIDPRVPRDLETIVLKAINKEPARRYQTSLELADDLRRFIEDRPVRARRAGYLERVGKWSRRRPALAGLLLGILAVAILGFAGVTGALCYAVAGWKEADEQRLRANDERTVAQLARFKAEDHRRRAETNLYYSRFAQARLEWRLNNVDGVKRLLEQCPSQNRGWEWSYLKSCCHADLMTLLNEPEEELVCSVTYSPDGQRLAVAAGSLFGPKRLLGGVKIWEAFTDKYRLIPTGTVSVDVAFSPDGKRIAAKGQQGTVKIWEADTAKELATLQGHWLHEATLALSPNGLRLAVGGQNEREVQLYDAVTAFKVGPALKHQDEVKSVIFSPDGAYIASCGPDGVYLWDAANGTLVRFTALPGASTVAFSPDGKRVAVANGAAVVVGSVLTGQSVLNFGAQGSVAKLAFSPDGRFLATAGADRAVRIWDTHTGEERMTLRGHSGRVSTLSFHPSGRYLASGSQQPGEVKMWDLTTQPEARIILRGNEPPRMIEALTFSADDTRMLIVRRAGAFQVLDALSGRVELAGNLNVTDRWLTPARPASFSRDGNVLAAVAGMNPKEVVISDTRTGRELTSVTCQSSNILTVAISADAKFVAACGVMPTPERNREIRVWDVASSEETTYLEIKGQPAHLGVTHPFGVLALSPDGRLLAFDDYADSGSQVRVKVWDVAEGSETRSLSGLSEKVGCLAFSNDGRFLAGSSDSGHLLVWDLPTGQALYDTPAHCLNSIADLAWSPDGRRLAGVNRNQGQVWDVATGQEVLPVRGAPARDWDGGFNPRVSWSHDGAKLASANWDGSVCIWDASPTWEAGGKTRICQAANQRAFGWHLQAAIESARRKDAFALEFHKKHVGEPPTHQALLERGEWYASMGLWDQATEDYAKAIAALPALETPQIARRHALLRLRVGDLPAYRGICSRTFEAWGTANGPESIQYLGATFALSAPDKQQLDQVLVRVEDLTKATGSIRECRYLHYVVGKLRYRAGRHEEAIQAFGKFLATQDGGHKVQPWLYLAMAHERLGDHEQAQRWLSKALLWFESTRDQTAEAKSPWRLPISWDDWLECQYLLQEATILCKTQ